MMAANINNHYPSSSRQHSHLPSHLAPLPPLEPSADRHHPYHLTHAAGRRGSTDPILHASIAASASAAVGTTSASYVSSNLSASSLSNPSPFDAPRRRSIQIEPTLPSNHGSPFASPSHSALHSSRFLSQNNSPAPLAPQAAEDNAATLAPRHADGEPSSRPSQLSSHSNYQFGSYSTTPNPEGLYRNGGASASAEDIKPGSSALPRIPTVSAPDGDGGGSMMEGGHPLHHHALINLRRGSTSTGSKHLTPDKDAKPYSRSPELRVSHKLAERKRRKEMKELFDDLRDQIPVDKGLKTSKWEILSKAVEHISQLSLENQDLKAELDALRRRTGDHGMHSYHAPQYASSTHLAHHHDTNHSPRTSSTPPTHTHLLPSSSSPLTAPIQQHHHHHHNPTTATTTTTSSSSSSSSSTLPGSSTDTCSTSFSALSASDT